MTRQAKAERQEAIDKLREWIKPGDTVYTILDSVSRSGMSRVIRVVLFETETTMIDGQCIGKTFDRHPNYAVGKALGLKHAKRNGYEQDGLVIGGCGMDMGFHLVYELSSVLYGAHLEGDVYLDSATRLNKDGTGPFLTREGAPEGKVWVGGYKCLGKGKCPSNYHTNHRDHIPCEGTKVYNPDGPDTGERCWNPEGGMFSKRDNTPENWPRNEHGRALSCIGPEENPTICPTCNGVGYVPNPEGPERFDLIHTDGYALRHRWL